MVQGPIKWIHRKHAVDVVGHKEQNHDHDATNDKSGNATEETHQNQDTREQLGDARPPCNEGTPTSKLGPLFMQHQRNSMKPPCRLHNGGLIINSGVLVNL